MRKTILVVTSLLCLQVFHSTRAAAQTDSPIGRGSMLLGGSASLTSTKASGADTRANQFQVNPEVLYFVVPHLAVGGVANLLHSWGGGSSSTGVGAGPAAAYFFGGPGARLLPFAQGAVLWQHASGNSGGSSASGSNTLLDGSAGAVLMVARSVGISMAAFYSRSSGSTTIDGEEFSGHGDTFGLRFGVTAFAH